MAVSVLEAKTTRTVHQTVVDRAEDFQIAVGHVVVDPKEEGSVAVFQIAVGRVAGSQTAVDLVEDSLTVADHAVVLLIEAGHVAVFQVIRNLNFSAKSI